MDMRIPVNITLPRDVVSRVDEVAGPRNRSAFVEAAIRDRLRREEMRRAFEAAAGTWKDHPGFPTSESVVEWVREIRAEETDPGPP
jgi:predicted transcriptional regulator